MLPGDVKLEERPSLGRRALHDYLEYAKSGRLPSAPAEVTEREEENDFEWSVAKALQANGFDTQPQVGVAGYFIDLGVRHPTRRGEFLAGLECDGVTYHSSLSARDRDRIRQEVLESLGWRDRIIRVWSTDWFADPAAQTERLVRFLRERLLQDEASAPAYAEDDFDEQVEEPPVAESSQRPELVAIQPQPAASTRDDEARLVGNGRRADLFIELGDRVTFEIDSDSPERHTIQIVDSASNPKLGLLNDQTPVAQALMGLCEGDDAELRVKDYPVRTMRIVRVER
jgi:very-short-patch-repair endonuclease